MNSDRISSIGVKKDLSMYFLLDKMDTETNFAHSFPHLLSHKKNPPGASRAISVPLSTVLILQSREMNHKSETLPRKL